MAHIGIDLGVDQLVLTRGRDFKWLFTNLDNQSPPQPEDFPAGQLFFEISTHGEEDGRGHIDMRGANGGTYTLSDGTDTTAALPFDISQDALKQAIEGFSSVGVGNVEINGVFTPQWIFTLTWSASMSLSAGVVQLFNSTVTDAFNALNFLSGGLGVTLAGSYTANTYTFWFTYKGNLLETEIVTFAAGVINDIIGAIDTALNAVEQFTGFIAELALIYAPLRHYDYEFINDKAQTPMPAITGTSSLTGVQPSLSVVQDAKGQASYTVWPFTISGPTASLTVEAADADAIPDRTKWQLVFLADGSAESTDPLPKGTEGGDAIARGTVRVQAER